jgi:hypothetical protein
VPPKVYTNFAPLVTVPAGSHPFVVERPTDGELLDVDADAGGVDGQVLAAARMHHRTREERAGQGQLGAGRDCQTVG